MPRNRRRYYRRNGALPLVLLLLFAIVLLVLAQGGRTYSFNLPDFDLPRVNLPPLPNITIPITGLPEVKIPAVRIPVTVEPGTLVPGISIAGTPAPAGAPNLGARTKTSGCQLQGNLPDRACTPGSVMSTDADAVCRSGYASSVRDVSQREREQVYAEYGITGQSMGQYQVDHLVPPSLGGSNDIANLWPQPASPAPGFEAKDALENYLQDQVCSGQMTLADAQRAIATNWEAAYNQMPK
jgi:hypothetical protein